MLDKVTTLIGSIVAVMALVRLYVQMSFNMPSNGGFIDGFILA